ncbi:hypothetical protein PENSUB_4912 [Penicillium subrubescens]|uniref:Zn(2)-C6 fungal-type domain-containing protein n=1 Tax=Penicillium subrubescens TaxID=1316194 RepID=A0A1Q5UAZ9_9EURO|nr:hypothetical protein PENSUB_4912 [Penicillium subrubescens]
MPPTPACDRCHSVKARCLSGTARACYRCYRLGHSCTYARPRGKRGRKPRVFSPCSLAFDAAKTGNCEPKLVSEASTTSSSTDETHEDDGPEMQKLPLVSTLYREGVISQITEYTSIQICNFFSFGPLLSREMCHMIRYRVQEAPTLLLSPYAAVARVFLRSIANKTPCNDADLSNCASALKDLRNAQITKSDYAGSFLSLGTSLVTFHRLISGVSASTICRHTLTLIRPFYYAGKLQGLDTRELVCLIFLDTSQSLFRARIPVIQLQEQDPSVVNQQAGLCGSLIPLLYRVCVLASGVRTGDEEDISHSITFDILSKELKNWSPIIPDSVFERFSPEEMMLLISQANLHQNAARLILHRLRYPFGEQDTEAEALSSSIVERMTHCLGVAGRYPPNITLVLLVAGSEVHEEAKREEIRSLVLKINGARFYPFIENLLMSLSRVWKARDQGTARYLFSLFENDPDLNIPL